MTVERLKTKPALRVVMPETADIYASWKADIAARDWSRVQVEGDRNPPIELGPRRRWGWWQ